LETANKEIPTGTPVLVTFTVSWFEWRVDDTTTSPGPKSPSKLKSDGFQTSLSLNLQEIVVLYELEEDHGDETAGNDSEGSVL
jgi:hypothetical protein